MTNDSIVLILPGERKRRRKKKQIGERMEGEGRREKGFKGFKGLG